MEERLLYVVYTFDNMGGWGVGSVLLENTKAPKNSEEIQEIAERIKKHNKLKEVILTDWFYLDSK